MEIGDKLRIFPKDYYRTDDLSRIRFFDKLIKYQNQENCVFEFVKTYQSKIIIDVVVNNIPIDRWTLTKEFYNFEVVNKFELPEDLFKI